MSNQSRVKAGTPSGGQFAASQREEAGVSLSGDEGQVESLRAQIVTALDTRAWDAVAPLVDRLVDAGWQPNCPTCGQQMAWERDMAEPDEQWLWCQTCSDTYQSDAFPELP